MICGCVRKKKTAYLQYQLKTSEKRSFWKTINQMNIKIGVKKKIPTSLKNV